MAWMMVGSGRSRRELAESWTEAEPGGRRGPELDRPKVGSRTRESEWGSGDTRPVTRPVTRDRFLSDLNMKIVFAFALFALIAVAAAQGVPSCSSDPGT